MEEDEVLTGKKKDESTIEDALYSSLGKPVSEDVIKEAFKKKPLIPELNPEPYVKIVELKGKNRKSHQGVEIGLKFSF